MRPGSNSDDLNDLRLGSNSDDLMVPERLPITGSESDTRRFKFLLLNPSNSHFHLL